ncbi:MAG TPA: UDP-N-acetylmuramoyl-L-alanine--D-glutamate ligase [Thermoanaerobaculia bacterium]|jgi:UDP-N-acetylmuramoylalanine--D-glutamate ligase|nr:UDP-N-acetylmuramoyl-L-alanine--D-glutamate ligase [Thermoanaerobaculia bacterium]
MSEVAGGRRREAGADGGAARRAADLPERVAVLGFARSGRALADALAARGVVVSVGDSRPEAEFDGLDALRDRGVRFFFGGPPPGFLEDADWLAVSPGVPLDAAPVRQARDRGIPVLSELEIAWRIAEAEAPGRHRWVAVTGTNGKSTTTTWIAEILRRAGRPAVLAGNIGAPLSGFLAEQGPRDFVCEVSSFQLEAVERFHPHVAVLTNITPDHLDRYDGFEAYAGAKARLFARQEAADFAVINADDAPSRAVATRARRVLFSRRGRPEGPTGAWLEAGELVSDVAAPAHAVVAADRLALPGAHNLENALAALAAAECLGAPGAAIVSALTRFEGLPHRSELVAEGAGVRWVDDSKGTNVDATAKSLEGYAPASVLLILGGRDKHGDFAALREPVRSHARAVLTIGEAAPVIERALEGTAPLERSGTMGEAVARAARLARPGDTVLLSPACASFDQYRNYEERGRHFAELARAAARGSHGP